MSGNIQVDPISSQMLQAVGRAAFLYFLLRGVLALGFGLFAVLAPTGTIHAIVVAFGLFAILDGIIALVSSFLLRGLNWNWLVTSGLLGIAFGVVCLRWPETTVYASLLLIAAWALASGALVTRPTLPSYSRRLPARYATRPTPIDTAAPSSGSRIGNETSAVIARLAADRRCRWPPRCACPRGRLRPRRWR